MDFKEAVKFLEEYKLISNTVCSYCGALNKETPEEILFVLSKCTDCIVDLQCKGNWSGYGIAALAKAFKMNPLNKSWLMIFMMLSLVNEEEGE